MKKILHTHDRNSVALYFVCTENIKTDLWYQFGNYCVSKFLIKLHESAEQCIGEMKKNKNAYGR